MSDASSAIILRAAFSAIMVMANAPTISATRNSGFADSNQLFTEQGIFADAGNQAPLGQMRLHFGCHIVHSYALGDVTPEQAHEAGAWQLTRNLNVTKNKFITR